jgi:hypothetical protein
LRTLLLPWLRGGAVDPIPQLLAGLECGHLARRDLDRRAGLRVSPRTRGGFAHREGAEATQIDPLALGKSFGDGLNQRIDGGLYLRSRQAFLLRNDIDQISLLPALRFLLCVPD